MPAPTRTPGLARAVTEDIVSAVEFRFCRDSKIGNPPRGVGGTDERVTLSSNFIEARPESAVQISCNGSKGAEALIRPS